MKITAHEISLTQRHLWRSTREAIPVQHAVIVEVGHDGVAGFGEASAFMTDHYNSTLDQLHSDVRRVAPLLAELRPDDPFAVWEALAAELPRSPFALAAIDAAVHDLRARLLGVPMWKALGLDRPQGLRSSFSIGLDEPAVMVGKLRERLGWSAYKVKLADPADLTVLRLLRRHTDAPFYVDGNCGWELAQVVPALAEMQALGVSLIEQPFPRAAWTHARILKGLSPIPVIADESITSPADLDACTEAFHGINVKPMKAGGITPSLLLLRAARERGLITMLGCMPESAAGVSGTAHLGALADHLDVDVVDLLAVNTGHGLTLDSRGEITVPDRPGSGYLPDPAALGWRVRPVPAADVRPIRQQVLRPGQPVELCAYPEDDKPGVRHFGALQKGRMVGAASVYHEDPPAEFAIAGLKQGRGWRLRGMATIDEIRGTGAGTALLRTAVTHAVLAGADVVWCNARTSVADFYRRHGFRTLGEEFEMPGIGPHSFMYWSQTGRLTRRIGNPSLSAVESGFPTITAAAREGDDSFMTSYFPRQQEVPVIPEQAARTLTRIALTEAGVPASDASQVADALVDTSLRGIDTHGLRLLPQYLDELATGVANAEPDIQFVKDRGAGVMLDADGALGVLAGLTAARFAEQRARAYGVAAVGVRNSNHFGAASVYTRSLARHGLVGIAVTSAASRVAPYGGVEPLFGTNPISIAAGGQDHGDDEFALDMATSQVCFGEVKHRRAQGRPLDGGWATDADGHPTNDPDEAYALSPLGGYKGQGLAMLVTLLGSVLTGAPLDWQLSQVGEGAPGTGRGVGHFVLALDPGAFAGQMDFTAGLTDMLHTVRAAIPAIPNQPVLVPGDPQRAHERERRQDGIALDARTADVLTALAANHDLPGPTAAVVTDEGIAS